MKDFFPKGTGNSRFLKSVANFLSLYPNYETFAAALISGTLPIDLNGVNPGGYNQLGTAINKANLLTDATAAALELAQADPTVNDAFNGVNTLIGKRLRGELLSYTGTGTGGSSNPCTLTFSKPVDLVIYLGEIPSMDGAQFIVVMGDESTSYQQGAGLGYVNGNYYHYGKKSSDGKTYSWYCAPVSSGTYSSYYQLNTLGEKYSFIGISGVQ